MNSGGFSISKENEANGMNCWVPATPNNMISSRVDPVTIQLQDNNNELSNWQQLFELRNDQPYELINSYQSVQDLDLYNQVERNEVHIYNPNSFMALLGVDESYSSNSALLDGNQGINRASQGYPNMRGNLSNGTDTLINNSASVNPPWMASQYAALNRGLQLSQVNSASLNPPWMAPQYAAQNRGTQLSQTAVQDRSFQQVNRRPAIPNLNVQASADWMDNNSANMQMMNQNHNLISSSCTFSKDVFQLPEVKLDYFHQAASATVSQASKLLENRQCETLELPESNRQLSLNIDNQNTDKQISVTENGRQQRIDLVQPNGDTSSRIISTPEKKTGNEKGEGQVIDLDSTPHHKTPKRRKHRPKVIREGKPKKAPKPETPNKTKLSEKPKRKYTRKSSLNASGSQPSDIVVEPVRPSEEPSTNSCRRALSFENQKTAESMEKISNTQPEQMRQVKRMEFDSQRHSAVQTSRQNESLPSIHQTQVVNNLSHTVQLGVNINNQCLVRPPPTRTTTFQDLLMGNNHGSGSITTQQRCPPTEATSFQDLLLGNTNYGQLSASSQIVHVNQTNSRPYCPIQRFISAENSGQFGLQTKNTHDNLSKCGLMVLGRYNQQAVITSDGVQSEARRSKREREFINEKRHFHGNASVNASQSSRVMDGGYATQQKLQEAEKRRRLENMLYMQMHGAQNQHFAEIISRQPVVNNGNCAPANMRPSNFPYPWLSNSTNISQSAEYIRYQGAGNGVSASSAAFNHYFKELSSSEPPSNISQMQNMGNLYNRSPVPDSNHNVQHTPAKPLMVDSQQSVTNGSSTVTEKQYSRPTTSGLLVKTIKRAGPSGDKQAITNALNNGSTKKIASSSYISSHKKHNEYQTSSSSKRGQLRKKDIRDLIDDIVHQMEELNLDGISKKEKLHPGNAIVPYKGDGPVVMYQAKKRKPRPKVDLDAESERIWKLLMGKEGLSEGTDADKEKWWEQERYMFQLRADAFISRMHLVQGDRRFSKWKGSVVDSVIGVFLTQNVSDHLSSSAFMSLAARFPLSLSSRQSCADDDAIIEEPEICIIDLEDTTINDEAKQTLSYGHFAAPQNEGKSMTSVTEIVNVGDDQIRGANNETISPDSFDSFICLTKRGSLYGSNSEVEEQLSTRNPSNLFKTYKPTEIAQTSLRDNTLESPQRSSRPLEKTQGASEKEYQQSSGGESVSSCLACDASECSSNTSDLESQSKRKCKQDEHPREKTEGRSNLNEHLGCPLVHLQGIEETTQHLYNDHSKEGLIFQSDKTSAIEGVTEAILKEQDFPSDANINSKGSSPKARKGNQDVDKKTNDWDELRKEAQRKITRSKNKNNMDSMDYETMRQAEVKEISDAIKERGMNNMLAERMKDFLNRLVSDHGSTDLEWLRDAPPDKAKDYLLSIRGLGLKSVECVRLLTLHHLAFPVDTNVGRIAVRLGWVPLQPLPESLQLHLLEMYPILETIQKYLWPRLCKLDQRTLYELHYQMITFGKVFCTKSKPNCNACPMRAECRHFASAFASARLALPAPEERNIIPSRFSVQSDEGPVNVTQIRTLLEWGNQVSQVERFRKTNCEPIVEEPKTPEQEPEEVSEIDIEDSFGEDTDKIPSIKLDVPTFSQTLKSYMHDNNIEVQEGDMSKALVALTEEAASLQPQKLKYVSRLRTEHQVYELPDDHPLLKEMEKREPDDPSPYLLAIWTPGETALSTQPPESLCQSDDPCKLCSEQTCFSCNSKREADSNIVRGTLLIPCRTAMRGSFPLNGTYFQVNEMFADHESSMNPIYVPREWIWDLPRRTVYFGTSASSIFKGMTTERIQYCFWRGFVCVRGFDQRYRAPRPLLARLHHPASNLVKTQGKKRNDKPVEKQDRTQ